jgi:galactokinase
MHLPHPTVFGAAAEGAARSPGRVNLIGEHTDYHGGLALPAAIALGTTVAVRWRRDGWVRGRSAGQGDVEASLDAPAAGTWLDHVRGVAQLGVAGDRWRARGFDVEVHSDLPVGAGLASSAALGVATAFALHTASGLPDPDDEARVALALLAWEAERTFVGVPCGTMDQLAVACPSASHALLVDCAASTRRAVRVPETVEILILDTGVRRRLADGRYAALGRRGHDALAEARRRLGRPVPHLSALTPEDLTILRLDGLGPVLHRVARHVVGENERVRRFVDLLEAGDGAAAGRLWYDSHRSLRDDLEVSWPEADFFVTHSLDLPGVLGARQTGAGWGGCTVHLVESRHAEAAAHALGRAGAERFGRPPRLWHTPAAAGARIVPLAS